MPKLYFLKQAIQCFAVKSAFGLMVALYTYVFAKLMERKMLCCDSSKHQHSRRHYEVTGHSVISSAQLGEQRLWCFVHEQEKDY